MTIKTDQTISHYVRLSSRVCIDITMSMEGVVCEWDWATGVESQRPTKRELRMYFIARNACASELARLIGGNVVVIEEKGPRRLLMFYPDGRVETKSVPTSR